MKEKLEILLEAFNYIERFDKVINEQIAKLEENDITDIYTIIEQMAEGIEWLLGVFKITEDIQLQKVEGQKINVVIKNIIDALENKDFILIKDTFEYELIPQLREWKDDLAVTLEHNSK